MRRFVALSKIQNLNIEIRNKSKYQITKFKTVPLLLRNRQATLGNLEIRILILFWIYNFVLRISSLSGLGSS